MNVTRMSVLSLLVVFVAGIATAEEKPPRFVIRTITVPAPSNQTGGIHLDRLTGKAYQPSGNFWKLVEDPQPIPQGRYDLHLTVVGPGWTAFRWNVDTGETWRLDGNSWRKAEFVDKLPGAPPADVLGVE